MSFQPMNKTETGIEVKIMGKNLQVSCPPNEEKDLLEAARYLNEQFNEIKTIARTGDGEKLSAITALNITHELLKNRRDWREKATALAKRIEAGRKTGCGRSEQNFKSFGTAL